MALIYILAYIVLKRSGFTLRFDGLILFMKPYLFSLGIKKIWDECDGKIYNIVVYLLSLSVPGQCFNFKIPTDAKKFRIYPQ